MPKTSPKLAQTSPRNAQHRSKTGQRQSKTGSRQPKMGPRQFRDVPKTGQTQAKTAQDAPRTDHDRLRQAKTAHETWPRQERDSSTWPNNLEKSKHAQANSRLAHDSPQQFQAALDWSKTGPTQAKTAHGLPRTSADMSWAGPSHAHIRPRQTCGRPKTDRRQAQDNACHS